MKKAINTFVGVTTALLFLGFVYVWTSAPMEKRAIQDWWYGLSIDCEQLQRDVSNQQRCERSADCELSRRAAASAEELQAQYRQYCSRN